MTRKQSEILMTLVV